MSALAATPTNKRKRTKQTTRKKKRITFSEVVLTRQPSAQDDEGNSIPDTAVHGTETYCPINKKSFFAGQLIPMCQRRAYETVLRKELEKRLQAATTEGKTPKDTAEWLVPYLNAKKEKLLSSDSGQFNILV